MAVIPKAEIEDVIAKKRRYADFLLVDASGNVDVLEIKRAFGKDSLMMRRTYRENHIPARELTGGIAQIEKYLHLLLNWSREGERKLTEKARSQGRIPNDLNIRFLNPRGLLLIGGCELTEDEQPDFDLIRRQYAHVADVITYGDLLQRLDRMLAAVGAE